MAKEVFDVYRMVDGDKVQHCQIELDRVWFEDGKLPSIISLPDGLMAYRYMSGYCLETGYFVSPRDIVSTNQPIKGKVGQADGEEDTSHLVNNGYRYRDYPGQG